MRDKMTRKEMQIAEMQISELHEVIAYLESIIETVELIPLTEVVTMGITRTDMILEQIGNAIHQCEWGINTLDVSIPKNGA